MHGSHHLEQSRRHHAPSVQQEVPQQCTDIPQQTPMQVHTEEGAGDILLFLTGQEEIENMERLIRQRAAHLPNLLKLQLVPVRAPPYRDLFDALVHLSTLLKLEHQAQNAISGP
jgi:HrpA-like RNA helicase